jgi:hypothetical protein
MAISAASTIYQSEQWMDIKYGMLKGMNSVIKRELKRELI